MLQFIDKETRLGEVVCPGHGVSDNHSSHILDAYYVPGTVLSILHELTHLILSAILCWLYMLIFPFKSGN